MENEILFKNNSVSTLQVFDNSSGVDFGVHSQRPNSGTIKISLQISGNGESTDSPTTESCDEGLSPIGSSEDAYNYINNSMPKFGLYPVNYGNASGHDTIKDIEESKNAQQVEAEQAKDEQVEDDIAKVKDISGNGESTDSPTTESCDEGLSPTGSTEEAHNYIIHSMPTFGLYPVNYGNASGHDTIKDIEESKNAQQVEDEKVEGDIAEVKDMISGNEEATSFLSTLRRDSYLTPYGVIEDTTERSNPEWSGREPIDRLSLLIRCMPKFPKCEPKLKKKTKKVKDVNFQAEDVEGHRGDIIHDVDKLVQFINGEEEKKKGVKPKKQRNVPKRKQHKQ